MAQQVAHPGPRCNDTGGRLSSESSDLLQEGRHPNVMGLFASPLTTLPNGLCNGMCVRAQVYIGIHACIAACMHACKHFWYCMVWHGIVWHGMV